MRRSVSDAGRSAAGEVLRRQAPAGRAESAARPVYALARKLLPNRNAEIVVYCANRQCQNSHIAAHRLSVLGYTDVAVYPGGKQDWDEAGLTFESATEPAAPVQIRPARRNFPIAAWA